MSLPLTLLAAETPFYIGTYTNKGLSQGIMLGHLDSETGKLGPVTLAATATNPSFVALSSDGRFLYAAMETQEASVGAFQVQKDGSLTLLNTQPSGGSGGCHVWVAGNHVFVSNYGSGNISAFPIQTDGSLGASSASVQFEGQGTHPKRQEKPHAHGVITDKAAQFAYACDLGTDNIWSFRFDPKNGSLSPTEPPSGKVPPGSGPRHMALSLDEKFLYANNELTLTVTTFERSASGVLAPIQTIPVLPEGTPLTGASISEIIRHPSGKWLYVSNRGHNSLSVFAIGQDGHLTFVENVPSLVDSPRGFDIDPTGRWLVVGGQKDNKIAVLQIKPETGKLIATDQFVDVGAPVCIAFAPKP